MKKGKDEKQKEDTTASVSDEEEYEEETEEETEKSNPKKSKKDLLETKQMVEVAMKDMVNGSISEAIKPFMDQLNALKAQNEVLVKTTDMYKQEVEVRNIKEASELREVLQKEPYSLGKDFVDKLPLEQLRSNKSTIEATKLYKDFVAEQKKQPVIDKRIFETPEYKARENDFMEDFVKPAQAQWASTLNPTKKGGNA